MDTTITTHPFIYFEKEDLGQLFFNNHDVLEGTKADSTSHEVELLERMRAVQFAKKRLQNRELSFQQRQDLSRFIQMGHDARYQLMRIYMQQVLIAAEQFETAGIPLEAMIQEGNLGLMAAIDSYDLDGSKSFSDYAAEHISQAIENLITFSQNRFGI